jgi:hypothetical protein
MGRSRKRDKNPRKCKRKVTGQPPWNAGIWDGVMGCWGIRGMERRPPGTPAAETQINYLTPNLSVTSVPSMAKTSIPSLPKPGILYGISVKKEVSDYFYR